MGLASCVLPHTYGLSNRAGLHLPFHTNRFPITNDTFITVSLGNSKGFRSSILETGTKTKYIFLIINYNITMSHH